MLFFFSTVFSLLHEPRSLFFTVRNIDTQDNERPVIIRRIIKKSFVPMENNKNDVQSDFNHIENLLKSLSFPSFQNINENYNQKLENAIKDKNSRNYFNKEKINPDFHKKNPHILLCLLGIFLIVITVAYFAYKLGKRAEADNYLRVPATN